MNYPRHLPHGRGLVSSLDRFSMCKLFWSNRWWIVQVAQVGRNRVQVLVRSMPRCHRTPWRIYNHYVMNICSPTTKPMVTDLSRVIIDLTLSHQLHVSFLQFWENIRWFCRTPWAWSATFPEYRDIPYMESHLQLVVDINWWNRRTSGFLTNSSASFIEPVKLWTTPPFPPTSCPPFLPKPSSRRIWTKSAWAARECKNSGKWYFFANPNCMPKDDRL